MTIQSLDTHSHISSLIPTLPRPLQYKEYQDKSMKMFQPPGDNILCQCKVEIDLSGGEKVEEEVPAVTNVSGQRSVHIPVM